MKIILALIAAGALAWPQTQVNLSQQSRNVDFATFSATRPWRIAASLPAACLQGEAVFITTAASGQQLYLCNAPNTWEAPALASLLDFAPFKQSANVLAIGPLCVSGKVCRARLGERIFTLSAPATATLSGTGSGVIYAWIDESGLRMGKSGGGTLSCSANCEVVTGTVTTFPARSLPLAQVSYTNIVIDAISSTMDLRGVLTAQLIEAGPSANLTVTTNGVTGAAEVDLNSAIDLGGLVSTRVLRRGTAALLPVSCTVGDLYHQTDALAGIYECLVTDQWRGPLASLGSVATVDLRVTLLAQTGNAPAVTILPASHPAGMYRVCSVATVTTSAASGTLDLVLSWRSSAQGTNLTATLTSIAVNSTGETQGCRLIRSTGTAAVTVDGSDVGAAQYELAATAERLQ